MAAITVTISIIVIVLTIILHVTSQFIPLNNHLTQWVLPI